MRKTRKQSGGNMAEAQRRVDKWITDGDVNADLILDHLDLKILPKLPNNVKSLYCHDNKLTELPTLPDDLTFLLCFNNKLTSLPTLPNNLGQLYCQFNELTHLPELPNSLRELSCVNNKLRSLPKLPNKLSKLYCYNNNLTSLPTLPNSLIEVEYDIDKIGSIANINVDLELPSNLKSIDLTTKFIEYQKDFLEKLSNREKRILQLYTYNGDRIINQLLRGNISNIKKENPIFIKNLLQFIKKNHIYKKKNNNNNNNNNNSTRKITDTGIVKEFVNDFLTILKKVPVLKEELIVYRGLKRKEDINTHGNEVLSSTYDEEIANEFISDECCTLHITLKPGVRALWMEPISKFSFEKEILICPPFKFEETSHNDGEYNITISPVEKYRK